MPYNVHNSLLHYVERGRGRRSAQTPAEWTRTELGKNTVSVRALHLEISSSVICPDLGSFLRAMVSSYDFKFRRLPEKSLFPTTPSPSLPDSLWEMVRKSDRVPLTARILYFSRLPKVASLRERGLLSELISSLGCVLSPI
jgi:hypothetical protein